jgi:2-polyprenyl-3-methyl-5-hydroxy-6-metoxy-1,4-benzoquinol methylase
MDAVTFHSKQADKWEAGYKSSIFSVRLEVLDSLLPSDLSGQRWLDAGCGTGTISRWLGDHGALVTGIDASQEMIANAAAHPKVTYEVADVRRISFNRAYFDGIVCSSVIEYLDEPESALSEFNRILKPLGQLAVSAPHSAASVRIPLQIVYWLTMPLGKKRCFAFLDHSKHSFSAESLHAMLAAAGFATKQIVAFGSLGLPLASIGKGSLLMAHAIRL